MSALNSWSQMYAANIFRGYSYTAPCILSHGLHVTCSEYISEVQSSLIKNDLKSKNRCFMLYTECRNMICAAAKHWTHWSMNRNACKHSVHYFPMHAHRLTLHGSQFKKSFAGLSWICLCTVLLHGQGVFCYSVYYYSCSYSLLGCTQDNMATSASLSSSTGKKKKKTVSRN